MTTHNKQWALINGVLCGVIDCLVGTPCGEQVIETIGQFCWPAKEEPEEQGTEARVFEEIGANDEIRV